MTEEITIQAPGKINLTLDVFGRSADGYHAIRSVMQTIALHDTLIVRRTSASNAVTLSVTGDEAAGVPTDNTNIVARAAQIILSQANACEEIDAGLQITLIKRIPAQAGLGGGSSDAAAMLRAGAALFSLNLTPDSLRHAATSLGADVPFFLHRGTALAEGIGYDIKPLAPLDPPWHLTIVKPKINISTARAYAALDTMPERRTSDFTRRRLAGEEVVGNDFHAVALDIPEIAQLMQRLNDAPERVTETPPQLCGSGSAVFCRVHDSAAAQALARQLREENIGNAWATRTQNESRGQA